MVDVLLIHKPIIMVQICCPPQGRECMIENRHLPLYREPWIAKSDPWGMRKKLCFLSCIFHSFPVPRLLQAQQVCLLLLSWPFAECRILLVTRKNVHRNLPEHDRKDALWKSVTSYPWWSPHECLQLGTKNVAPIGNGTSLDPPDAAWSTVWCLEVASSPVYHSLGGP